jgi:hypothetical protein
MSKMKQRQNGSWLKGDEILPKHQHKIMLSLAKNGAMTMSQTNKKIRGENTSTTRAFHELVKKEMITEIGTMEYHGRNFKKYWLSGRGIAYVFLHDANPNVIIELTTEYLKDETIETYLKLHSLSHEIANLLDYHMFRYGKLDFEDLAKYVVSDVDYFGENEALEFLKVTNFSQEFYSELKIKLENMKRVLDEVDKIREK